MAMNVSVRATGNEKAGVEQRRSQRDLVDYIGQVVTATENASIRVVNISASGLMGRTEMAPKPGSRVSITLPRFGAIASEVRWIEDGRIGVEFVRAFDPSDYDELLSLLPARVRG